MASRLPSYSSFSVLRVKIWKPDSIRANWWATSRIARACLTRKQRAIPTSFCAGTCAAIGARPGQKCDGSGRILISTAIAIYQKLKNTEEILFRFRKNMKIETLHIGMKVRHPQYGVGIVKSLTEKTAEITFDDEQRTIAPESSDLQPAEPTAILSQLEMPLANLIHDTAHAVVDALGLEPQDSLVEGLAMRWQKGTLFMQSADSSLQPKEVPLETFFHKIVMIRNNLRVLEQKVNSSDKLSEADKFDLQQYITRCTDR